MLTRYDCPIGLSDHSGTPAPCLAAVTKGATLLEVHLTFSKRQFGPDTQASLTVEQLAELVRSARAITQALDTPVDKDGMAREFEDLHQMFTKSIVAASDLPRGRCLTQTDLAYKKPGDGIPANRYDSVIGRTLIRNVSADHFFSNDDFEA